MPPSSHSLTPQPLVVPPAAFSSPLASHPLSGRNKDFEDHVNPYFSSLPLNSRHAGFTPEDTGISSGKSQALFLPPVTGRNRGYSDASSSSDSSTFSASRSQHGIRKRILVQHPPGPAGNPKLNNSALQGIWDIYRREAEEYDTSMINSWHASIDNLILFAGLFSGIITTFLVESFKSLAPSRELVPGLPIEDNCRMFGCGPHAIRINTMWFTSLGLTLVSALVSMLAKQWISEYKVELLFSGTGSSEWFHEACRTRQFRFDGMRHYKMAYVISATPVLLHAGLLCFCIGLVDFLWTLNRTVAIPITVLCALTLFLYIGSTVSSVVSPRSPFKTALARLIRSFGQSGQEREQVEAAGKKLDEQVVEWLISTSRSQEIYQEAVQALLELKRATVYDSRTA